MDSTGVIKLDDTNLRLAIPPTTSATARSSMSITPKSARSSRCSSTTTTPRFGSSRSQQSPGYDPKLEHDRDYYDEVYGHYGYPPFWAGAIAYSAYPRRG